MDGSGWIDLKERLPTEEDGERVLVWHIYQGAMAERREQCDKNRFYSHWRRISAEGWISARERMPTREDGDEQNCVLARHEYDGIKVTGWHQFGREKYYTHWMRTPEPPEGHIDMRKMRED